MAKSAQKAERTAPANGAAIDPAAPKFFKVALNGQVRMIPFKDLEPSALNPRTSIVAGKLTEVQREELEQLADSIAREGVLENLIGRQHPTKGTKVEIAAGARRMFAIGIMNERKQATPDYLVPVLVKPMSDAELIATAIIENVQRADMHPLEEGKCFAAMRAAGDTTAKIAERMSKSQKWVQIRIAFTERLDPAVQKAFQAGIVNTKQAIAILPADKKMQREILEDVAAGHLDSAREIRDQATIDAPTVRHALFDLETYKAAGGALIEDDEGKEGPWFADAALFIKLQRAAVDAKQKELAAKWGGGCQVLKATEGQAFRAFEFNHSSNKKTACAVIEVDRDWAATVHEGLIAKPTAISAPAKAAKKAAAKAKSGGAPVPKVTQSVMTFAKNAKTRALQERIAFGAGTGDGSLAAGILDCLALMGEDEVTRIGPREIRGDDAALSPLLRDALEGFRKDLDGMLRVAPRGKDIADGSGILQLKDNAAAEAFDLMLKWKPARVGALYCCLLAARCGTFNNYMPKLGDDRLAIAVAAALKVDMAAQWGADLDNWKTYVGLLKKSRAVRLVEQMPGLGLDPAACAKMGTEELAGKILEKLEALPAQRAIVPPELTFGEEKAIEAAINTAPEKKAEAKKPAKAKTVAKAEKKAKGGKSAAPSKSTGKGAKVAKPGKGGTPAAEVRAGA